LFIKLAALQTALLCELADKLLLQSYWITNCSSTVSYCLSIVSIGWRSLMMMTRPKMHGHFWQLPGEWHVHDSTDLPQWSSAFCAHTLVNIKIISISFFLRLLWSYLFCTKLLSKLCVLVTFLTNNLRLPRHFNVNLVQNLVMHRSSVFSRIRYGNAW